MSRCKKCGCKLRQSNPGPLCAPCDRRPVEIPDWAVSLVDLDPLEGSVLGLAKLLGGRMAKDLDGRNNSIYRARMEGTDVPRLAYLYGLSEYQIRAIVNRERRREEGVKHDGKQARQDTDGEASVLSGAGALTGRDDRVHASLR